MLIYTGYSEIFGEERAVDFQGTGSSTPFSDVNGQRILIMVQCEDEPPGNQDVEEENVK